jgi:hypothetical protein
VNVDTGEFRALTAQVADLTARFEELERDAFLVKTLEQMIVEHAGYPVAQHSALKASQPRHLRPVDGSQP